jgi:hypothetical protein
VDLGVVALLSEILNTVFTFRAFGGLIGGNWFDVMDPSAISDAGEIARPDQFKRLMRRQRAHVVIARIPNLDLITLVYENNPKFDTGKMHV